MISAKFITFLAVFLSAALAGAAPRRIFNVVKEFVPVSRQSETSTEGLFTGTTGFFTSTTSLRRVTRVGISVVRGATATLGFDVTGNAVDAQTLNSMSSSFVETLTAEERAQFEELVRNYEGDLNLPFFALLGLNFAENISAWQIYEAAKRIENFETKFGAIVEILQSAINTNIRITGTLSATGQSNIPTAAFAFLRLANVEFDDGRTLVVVSSNPFDVVVTDRNGVVQPSEVEKFNILF